MIIGVSNVHLVKVLKCWRTPWFHRQWTGCEWKI